MSGVIRVQNMAEHHAERPDGGLLPEVFTRYKRAIVRSIVKLVRPQDVEDILQETYMRAFQAARRQPIRSPHAFMLRTARNLVLDRLSAADALNHVAIAPTSEAEAGEEAPVIAADSPDECTPEAVLESEQEFAVFCRAIRGLPRQCRRVFLLRKVYGLSQREVAERLGITEGTVEKHSAKALSECRRYMREQGYEERSSTDPVAKRSRSGS